MILVTGATGNIGFELVRLLAMYGAPVRAFVRDPRKAQWMMSAMPGVQPFLGNLDDRSSLQQAFKDVKRVFILSPGPNVAKQDLQAIECAVEAEVEHLVLLSSLGVSSRSGSGPLHEQGELALRRVSCDWTVLRPSEFMSNVVMLKNTIYAQNAFWLPAGDGRSAMIHPHDISMAAARILMTRGHAGEVYELTGPEALSRHDIAAKLSAVLGRPIQYHDIADAMFRDQLSRGGVPAPMIDPLARHYEMVRNGGAATVTPTYSKLTGARARTFDEWLYANGQLLQP